MGLRLRDDMEAVAPIIWAIVLIGSAIAGLGVYQVTQRPDITEVYNISETGFAIAGVDVSWFLVIGIVAIVIVLILVFARRKQPQQQPRYIYPEYRGRP